VITVRPGDTLYSLAHHYGVTVAALAERNNLMTPALKAGQTLALPPNAR
jgi:LysM repeat protein